MLRADENNSATYSLLKSIVYSDASPAYRNQSNSKEKSPYLCTLRRHRSLLTLRYAMPPTQYIGSLACAPNTLLKS
uniref:Uncharacterized protein n=1 Tax=Ascaris lumbricoides TaxID=6252 RepID=A0A0M3HQ72_ASCLU